MGGEKVKCVVWDLDNTIWNGVILEDKEVTLRDGIVEIIEKLDERGILQSIASRNEYSIAMQKLEELGIAEYFIYSQINWNSKSESLKNIADSINISIGSLAFIDDQPFEREEVSFANPGVLCLDASDLSGILDTPEMNPNFITEDSKIRRKMYMNDIKRKKIEKDYSGPQDEFLASLDMVLTINPVQKDDLQRAEELTVRTHQLNTTGYTYSYEELDIMRTSEDYKIFIVGLDDKYGTYGKIGLVLIECMENIWTIKLLLMSCRVISMGVGSILINFIMRLAKKNNVRLRAEFIKTDCNRMMYVTYKFAGFKEIFEDGEEILFENDLSQIQESPKYVKLQAPEVK